MTNAPFTPQGRLSPDRTEGWSTRLQKALGFVIAMAIFASLAMLLLWPRIAITVEAGHTGVFFDRLRGGTDLRRTYPEGVHLFLPWNIMTSYDCRVQRQPHVIEALAQGGLKVEIYATVVWALEPSRVNELHRRVGPDYREKLLDPLIVSVIRNTVGNFQQENIYEISAETRQSMQEETVRQVRMALREDSPIVVIDIMLQRIVLPETLQTAISEKFAAEQNVLTERYKILQAYERFKRNFIEADTIRARQEIIARGLSDNYLRYEGIAATRELAASSNAKLVIVGGKDGLPLLLNPDAMGTPASDAAGQAKTPAPADEAALDTSSIKPDYEDLAKRLAEIDAFEKQLSDDRTLRMPLVKQLQRGGLSLRREWQQTNAEAANPAKTEGNGEAESNQP